MDREKVLIVEDELDLLDLLDFNLTRKGFITCASMDGQDAVEKVRTFDPGLVSTGPHAAEYGRARSLQGDEA